MANTIIIEKYDQNGCLSHRLDDVLRILPIKTIDKVTVTYMDGVGTCLGKAVQDYHGLLAGTEKSIVISKTDLENLSTSSAEFFDLDLRIDATWEFGLENQSEEYQGFLEIVLFDSTSWEFTSPCKHLLQYIEGLINSP